MNKKSKYISLGFKGKHHSKKTKLLLSKKLKKIAKKLNFGKWMIGKKHSKSTILKIKKSHSTIKSFKDALHCKFLWDIYWGITLCKKCHDKIPKF